MTGSIVENHGISQFWRQIPGARGVFHFLRILANALDFGRENLSETKKINFFHFCIFFHPLWSFCNACVDFKSAVLLIFGTSRLLKSQILDIINLDVNCNVR